MRSQLGHVATAAILAGLFASAAPSFAESYAGSFGSPGSAPGQLAGPDGIATSDDGFVYVADTYNSRVQKFTATGEFVAVLGSPGTGPGQFVRPYGIDVDAAGNVYVGDLDRAIVQKFSSTGAYLASFGGGVLTQPFGLWVSDDGIVYVTDRPADVVRRFTADGTVLSPIGPWVGSVQLVAPQNIEGDNQGKLYVSDGHSANRVRVLTTAGALVSSFGSPWIGNPTGAALAPGFLFLSEYNLNRVSVVDLGTQVPVETIVTPAMNSPIDCATFGDSLLYVLDTGNGRVLLYWIAPGSPPQVTVLAPNGGEVLPVGSVFQVTWQATDDVTVASVDVEVSRDGGATYETIASGLPNTGTHAWTVAGPPSFHCRLRVVARDDLGLAGSDASDGEWTISRPAPGPVAALYLDAFGSPGDGIGQLAGPDGIATSDDGFVYVADTYNGRVQKFTATGQFVTVLGAPGTGPGQFQRPYGIDVDAAGNVYVGDLAQGVVQKFSSSGTYLATFGAGVLTQPFGLWVSDEGVVYVADRPAHVVQRFTTNGTPLSPIGASAGLYSPQNVEGDGQGVLYVSDGFPALRVRAITTEGEFVTTFGYPWIGNPTGAALASGLLYVTEYDLDRLSQVDPGPGAQRLTIDQAGGTSFLAPLDCATSGDSLLYVLDTGKGRVARFRLIAGIGPTVKVIAPNGGETLRIGSVADLVWQATDDGTVVSVDVAVSRDSGATYETIASGIPNTGAYSWTVTGAESYGCRLRVTVRDDRGLEATDRSDGWWSISHQGAKPAWLAFLDAFGAPGDGPGQLAGPDGIATSDDGFVYVADTYNSRVQKFTAAGELVGSFGSRGTGPGQFQRPYGIDVDAAGNVYVGDLDRANVQTFSADGTHLATFGEGVMAQPFGLWVSDEGLLYVTDRPVGMIRRYTIDGDSLAAWGPILGDLTLSAPQNIEGSPDGRLLYVSDGFGAYRLHVLNAEGQRLETYGEGWMGNPTGSALLGPWILLSEYNLDRVTIMNRRTGRSRAVLGDDESYALSSPIDVATLGDSLAFILDTANGRVVRCRFHGGEPPRVTLKTPNGGDALPRGATVPLCWTTAGGRSVVGVDLWISRDGGSLYEQIASDLPNTGRYEWSVAGSASESCRLRVIARDSSDFVGADVSDAVFAVGDGAVTVPEIAVTELALEPPTPNPTAGDCRIVYALPRTGRVRLSVFDVQGREIATLVNGTQGPGRHAQSWRGGAEGTRLPSGLYFVSLRVEGQGELRRRVVVLR